MVGGSLNPWQLRSHLLRNSNATRRRNPTRETSKIRKSSSRCIVQCGALVFIRTEASDTIFNLRANEHARFTMTPLVACRRALRWSLQTVNAARLLHLVVPTSTRFAAPLLT